jgi:hypothetical protein
MERAIDRNRIDQRSLVERAPHPDDPHHRQYDTEQLGHAAIRCTVSANARHALAP